MDSPSPSLPPLSGMHLLLIYVISLGLVYLLQIYSGSLGSYYYTLWVMALVLPAGLALALTGRDLEEYGVNFEKPLAQLGWSAAAVVIVLGGYGGAVLIYFHVQGISPSPPNRVSWLHLAYINIFIIAIPEEFLFRGFLQTSLEKRESDSPRGWMASVLITSLLFCPGPCCNRRPSGAGIGVLSLSGLWLSSLRLGFHLASRHFARTLQCGVPLFAVSLISRAVPTLDSSFKSPISKNLQFLVEKVK